MKRKIVRVIWPNGTKSHYSSIQTCATSLGLNRTSVYNYLRGKCPMGIRFEFAEMTGEEELLREITKIDPVIRLD